jgi:hypothetical protein
MRLPTGNCSQKVLGRALVPTRCRGKGCPYESECAMETSAGDVVFCPAEVMDLLLSALLIETSDVLLRDDLPN